MALGALREGDPPRAQRHLHDGLLPRAAVGGRHAWFGTAPAQTLAAVAVARAFAKCGTRGSPDRMAGAERITSRPLTLLASFLRDTPPAARLGDRPRVGTAAHARRSQSGAFKESRAKKRKYGTCRDTECRSLAQQAG